MAPPKAGQAATSEDTQRKTLRANLASSRRGTDTEKKAGGDEDKEDGDEDDAPASSDGSSSDYSSVSADILPPIHAYGHTFHGSGRLWYPHDETEDQRLNLQHELYKMVLDGRLHDARLPIEKDEPYGRVGTQQQFRGAAGRGNSSEDTDEDDEESEEDSDDDEDDSDEDEDVESMDGQDLGSARPTFHILDVGSGNGIWAVEAARRYPNAEVLGIDLTSALLPKDVPPNLTFEIADVAEPWPPRLYDFIHIRNLMGGGVTDWETLASRALAHLKPGGVLEFSELRPRLYGMEPEEKSLPISGGGSPTLGTALSEYNRILWEMSKTAELNVNPAATVAEYLSQQTVASVNVREDWVPIEGAPNDSRMKAKAVVVKGMLKLGIDVTTQMLFSKAKRDNAETEDLMERLHKELDDPELRTCFNLLFVTARMPLE